MTYYESTIYWWQYVAPFVDNADMKKIAGLFIFLYQLGDICDTYVIVYIVCCWSALFLFSVLIYSHWRDVIRTDKMWILRSVRIIRRHVRVFLVTRLSFELASENYYSRLGFIIFTPPSLSAFPLVRIEIRLRKSKLKKHETRALNFIRCIF